MGCEKICTIEKCGNPVLALSFCSPHYQRFRRYGDPLGGFYHKGQEEFCSVEGCEREAASKNMCGMHYQRYKRHGDPLGKSTIVRAKKICSISGCDRIAVGLGFCGAHYQRFKKYNDPLPSKPIQRQNLACSIDGCEKISDSLGWCKPHYNRFRRHGDPLGGKASSTKGQFCKISDCDSPVACLGFCNIHYERFRKYGDPLYVQSVRGTSNEKFTHLVKTKTVDENNCWLLNRKTDNKGYVVFSLNGKYVKLHRYSLHFFEGFDLNSKEQVHHKCANPSCFNPDHLQPVTARENVAEMHERNFYLNEIERLKAELAQALRTIEELQEVSVRA